MKFKHAIIHNIVKVKNHDVESINMREATFDLNNQYVIKLLKSSLEAISQEKNRVLAGQFLEDGHEGNVPSAIKQHFNIPESESDNQSELETNDAFMRLCEIAFNEVKYQIDRGNHKQFSTGGYLLFISYNHRNDDYFAAIMIKQNAGLAIDDDLNITDTIVVDLQKLQQAVKINITKLGKFCESANASEKLKDEENNDYTYLQFIKQKQSDTDCSDYFIEAFGCTPDIKTRRMTKILISEVSIFFKDNDNLKPFRKEMRDKLVDYLWETIEKNTNVKLDDVQNLLIKEINLHAELLPDNFNVENLVIDFINNLNSEKNIPSEFKADQKTVKEKTFVSVKSSSKQWELKLNITALGKTDESIIYFNEENGSVLIKNLSEDDLKKFKNYVDMYD